MMRSEDQQEGRSRHTRTCSVVFAGVFWLSIGQEAVLAETQAVIDPIEVSEPQKPPPPKVKPPPRADPALKRERQRAEQEQRRRAQAEARALAAENEAAQLRAIEQERQAKAAAQEAAAKAAARKAAAEKAAAARAEAAKIAKARIAAQKAAARKEAAIKAAAAKEAAARVAAARDAAAKEVAREIAAREAAEREAAAREAAAREAAAREAAVREAAAREAAAQEAAREAAAREAAKERAAREAAVREAAAREAAAAQEAAREAVVREAAAKDAAAREAAARLAAAREAAAAPSARSRFGSAFRDCPDCPEVVWLPQGELMLGGPAAAANRPRYPVKMSYMLAVGRFKVTFAEWEACVAAGGCRRRPGDFRWRYGRQPVTNVSWEDAQQYAAWLSRKTGKSYRLLTGVEWEYAARMGSEVYDMHGNVSEWVENCYQYRDARNGDRMWKLECTNQTVLGGTSQFFNALAAIGRSFVPYNYFDTRIGFRIARTE